MQINIFYNISQEHPQFAKLVSYFFLIEIQYAFGYLLN